MDKDEIEQLKIGDIIRIQCDRGFGSGGNNKLTGITRKHDVNTGEPYNLLWFGDHAFDARTGKAYNPPTAYFLDYKVS